MPNYFLPTSMRVGRSAAPSDDSRYVIKCLLIGPADRRVMAVAQTRTEQRWVTHFRQDRQECLDKVPHACMRFEDELAAQRAYNLYYNSITIPG